MMKRLAAAAGLALASCSQQQPTNQTAADTITPAANTTISPIVAQSTSSTATPSPSPSAAAPGTLPPADSATPRYVGRWAATKQLCASGAWRFHATHLETAGEVSCTYRRVDAVPGGYELHATCTAQAPPQPDTITLRFAESAQAMLVDSKVLPSIGLIYCGPLASK